jgi:hypothetical protein
MAAESTEDDSIAAGPDEAQRERAANNGHPSAEHDSEEGEEEEDEAEEEPKLKYTRLTSSLGPVYRNGDATSTFLVAGDKMVGLCYSRLQELSFVALHVLKSRQIVGTHNGNIVSTPLSSLRASFKLPEL